MNGIDAYDSPHGPDMVCCWYRRFGMSRYASPEQAAFAMVRRDFAVRLATYNELRAELASP